MTKVSDKLESIRSKLEEENEETKKEIDEAMEVWSKYKEKFVIYLEHTELEKVEMYIIEAKSHIETNEYNMAIESIDTCIFIIDHIKEKYDFTLKNIF